MFHWLLLVALLILPGCSQDDLLNKFSTPEDQALARSYIDQLRERRFEEIEKAIDPAISTPGMRAVLGKMADLIPAGSPNSIKLVGAHRHDSGDTSTVNTTFQYNFGDKWLLANVAVKQSAGKRTIVGFNVNPIADSLENLNRFTLSGKNATQYGVLVGAILATLLSIYALVQCARTKDLRRKWLWIVFILFGIGRVAVDWSTGAWMVNPLHVQLLSSSAFAAYSGPWTISASLPLGALVFLIHRMRRRTHAESPVQ